MKRIINRWKSRWCRHARGNTPGGLPSLVHGISLVVPQRVLREVMTSTHDRRQWGVMAAGWMGLSEREFMSRVATRLGLELHERVTGPDLSRFGAEATELLHSLRRVGAVPIMEGGQIVGFVAIDPAEVPSIRYYDESQTISIAPWSEISRALEESEQLLGEADTARSREEAAAREALCLRVCELLCGEAQAHGASTLDVIASQERGEYRFVATGGQTATGVIHAGAIPEVMNFLCSRPGNIVHSNRVGPVIVRMLGGPSHLRLAWGRATKGEDPGPVIAEREKRAIADVATAIEPAMPHVPDQATILVVDDNLMFGRVLEKLLKREGFEPSFATNGAEAFERLSQSVAFVPRVIVCDLHMPVMNGKEFLVRLRADVRFRAVPVVMLTSDDDVEAEIGLLESGADAFVSKTKDPRVLCAQIRKLARRAELQEAA